MSKKLVCDHCGSEITPKLLKGFEVSLEQKLKRYGIARLNYDLCYDCYEELKDWLKGGKEE